MEGLTCVLRKRALTAVGSIGLTKSWQLDTQTPSGQLVV